MKELTSDASSRQAFLERLSVLSGLAVITGCAGGTNMVPSAFGKQSSSGSGNHSAAIQHFVDPKTGAANVVANGVTLSTITNGNTVSLTSTDANGVATVLMTASLDPSSSNLSFYSRGSGVYQTNVTSLQQAPPSSLPVLGHTVTSGSSAPTTSTISGPVVSNGSASLVGTSDTSAVASGTYDGVTQTRSFSGGGTTRGGGGCYPVCRNSAPAPRGAKIDPNQLISGILAGIAFLAGMLALIFFLPEMALGAVILAVIDVIASLADMLWNLITL